MVSPTEPPEQGSPVSLSIKAVVESVPGSAEAWIALRLQGAAEDIKVRLDGFWLK
jgi:hypothetical protein